MASPIIPKKELGSIWVFPNIGVPENGWFIVENPIEMDDLGGFPPIFGGSTPNFTPLFRRKNKNQVFEHCSSG